MKGPTGQPSIGQNKDSGGICRKTVLSTNGTLQQRNKLPHKKKHCSLWLLSWMLSVLHPSLWWKPWHEKPFAKGYVVRNWSLQPAATWVRLDTDPPAQSCFQMTAAPAQVDGNLMNQNLNQNNQDKIFPETVWDKKCLLFFKKWCSAKCM